MHQNINIRNLLLKFVNNECSAEEKKEVLRYFQGKSYARDMPEVEEVLENLSEQDLLDQEAADQIFRNIVSHKTTMPKRRTRMVSLHQGMWKYGAAAIVIFILVAGILFQKGNNFSDQPRENLTTDMGFERTESITLELGNGQIEVIHPDGSRTVRDEQGNIVGRQEKSRLVYSAEQAGEMLEYNTLRVPYSKRFEIGLSDGTKVHLNSGSTIKFPVHFPQNSTYREVELTGEAYFEVAHNQEQPFIVNAGGMNVRVLGTKFNVSTYPEDDRTDVVLVDGSVSLDIKNEDSEIVDEQLLKPGYKASFDKLNKSISQAQVPTSIYTSWIQGELVFRDMEFEDILQKLERKYNITIQNSNTILGKERFNASFGDVALTTVLQYFETIYGIEFSVENDIVFIQ